jgi:hypothetical protein
MARVAGTAFWTIIAVVVAFRIYGHLMLPVLLKWGVSPDLCMWTEPRVIRELIGWTFGLVFVAALAIFPWNNKLSLLGFLFWIFLWGLAWLSGLGILPESFGIFSSHY